MPGGTFATLQHLLKQTYSVDVSERQQAAIELNNLIEQVGSFPAVSFGPLGDVLLLYHYIGSLNNVLDHVIL
jgi:hypothetical protein